MHLHLNGHLQRLAYIFTLIDVDNLVELLQAFDGAIGRRIDVSAIQLPGRDPEQSVVDQCRLAGAGNTGDTGHQTDREFDVD